MALETDSHDKLISAVLATSATDFVIEPCGHVPGFVSFVVLEPLLPREFIAVMTNLYSLVAEILVLVSLNIILFPFRYSSAEMLKVCSVLSVPVVTLFRSIIYEVSPLEQSHVTTNPFTRSIATHFRFFTALGFFNIILLLLFCL